MITLFVSDFKHISQQVYDREIAGLQLHRLSCPSCGHSSCLSIHGYYLRSIHTPDGLLKLRILRVKCSCGRTHAILLSSMVPYSRIPLEVQSRIAACESASKAVVRTEIELADITEWAIRNIHRNFQRLWKEMLLSITQDLEHLADLVRNSFRHFRRQFMQIHCGMNQLFIKTT